MHYFPTRRSSDLGLAKPAIELHQLETQKILVHRQPEITIPSAFQRLSRKSVPHTRQENLTSAALQRGRAEAAAAAQQLEHLQGGGGAAAEAQADAAFIGADHQ